MAAKPYKVDVKYHSGHIFKSFGNVIISPEQYVPVSIRKGSSFFVSHYRSVLSSAL